jgi:pyrroline-5-carboxylate reductase
MHIPKIAIIGAGNMGSALISGLIKNNHPSDHILASDCSIEKLQALKNNFGINTSQENIKAIEFADVVIFAIKPQLFQTIAIDLAQTIHKRNPLILSVAAGIREASIQQWLGEKTAIVRVMPNTPALINCGAAGLYANACVTQEQRNIAESILRSVGVTVWLEDEKSIDTVTALSGCGPAYFFLMMEALQQAAEEFGLPQETARLLTLQTALGAARIAIESGETLEELRHNVTSPGGATEKAIMVLEENNLKTIFKDAMRAAKQRSQELAELAGN